MAHPVTIFYVYAETDETLRQQLEKHLALLQRQGVLTNWQESLAGAEWEQEREQAFNKASLILLLVSADFLASDVCYQEQMQRALERQKAGEVQVLPILVRPVDVTDAPFMHLPMVPTNGQAVTLWVNQDAAWTHITEGIRCVLEGKSLPMVQEQKETAKYAMENQGVQGPVMGEHNEIHQHYYAPASPPPVPSPRKKRPFALFLIGLAVLVISGSIGLATMTTQISTTPGLRLSPVPTAQRAVGSEPTAQQTVKPNPAFANPLFKEVTSLPGKTLALSCPQKEGVYALLAQTFATKICVANQTAQANFAIQAAFTLEKTNSGAIGLAQKYSDEKSPFAVFTLQSDDASEDGHCFYYNFVDFPSNTVDGFVEHNRQNHREPSQTTCFFDGGKPVVLTEIVVGGLVYTYINGEYKFTIYDERSNVDGEVGAFILSSGAKNGAPGGTGATKAGTVQDFKFRQFTVEK